MGVRNRGIAQLVTDLFFTNKSGQTNAKQTGVTVTKLAVATYDVSGGASGAIGSHGLGVYLPAKAVVTRAWIDIVTTFASATNAATIGAQVESTSDLVAPIAISNGTTPWTAGLHGTKVGNFALDGNALSQIAMAAAWVASLFKTTAVREITLVSAVEALTAGKANVYVEYALSD